jgi:hypothetical protein
VNPVPIQVVGDGQLAAWHRDVFARHAACTLLEQGLPDRTGVVDLCGPASACSDTMGLCVRQRIPVCLTVPTQWPTSDLARLQQAGAKRRLPMVALGSLRALPAVARLKEIASGRTLGTLHSDSQATSRTPT